MRIHTIASHSLDNFLFAIDDNIQDKLQIRFSCSVQHILVNRIFIDFTGSGMLAFNKFGTMISQHRHLGCNARQHGFTAARETRKEMRVNEPFGDEQFRFHRQAIDDALAARWQRADFHHIRSILRIMIDEFFVIHDILAEPMHHLVVRHGPVKASGNQNRNINRRIHRANATEQNRQRHLTRHRSRVITRNNNHIAFALNQCFKRRTINRMIKRLLNKLSRTLLRLIRRRIRHKNPLHEPFINRHIYTFIIIRKRIRLHTSTSCCIYTKYNRNNRER